MPIHPGPEARDYRLAVAVKNHTRGSLESAANLVHEAISRSSSPNSLNIIYVAVGNLLKHLHGDAAEVHFNTTRNG
jgi:hypothetical protein